MATLFISDLHLCAQRPAVMTLFLDFLRGRATHADALYILGDLFEYWIGDDAAADAEFAAVITGLRALTQRPPGESMDGRGRALSGTGAGESMDGRGRALSGTGAEMADVLAPGLSRQTQGQFPVAGVPVYVMHGNRDFLLGKEFTQITGCRLLPDPTLIDLYGTPVLLMHGDTLCTDDVDYQNFRRIVRDPQWIKKFLAQSRDQRNAVVRDLRTTSKAAMAEKPPDIMDVNPSAVESVMRTHRVHHLIHGHTHRPAQHDLLLDGQPARRTVLGDWYEQGSVLECDARGCVLESLR